MANIYSWILVILLPYLSCAGFVTLSLQQPSLHSSAELVLAGPGRMEKEAETLNLFSHTTTMGVPLLSHLGHCAGWRGWVQILKQHSHTSIKFKMGSLGDSMYPTSKFI